MDDLDRLYQRLAQTVRESFPHLAGRQFALGDVAHHLIPYRHHRRELGLESIQAYERALMRLAAGERGYLVADPPIRDAFRAALAEREPDPALLRTYADAMVTLAPEPLVDLTGGPGGEPHPPATSLDGEPSAVPPSLVGDAWATATRTTPVGAWGNQPLVEGDEPQDGPFRPAGFREQPSAAEPLDLDPAVSDAPPRAMAPSAPTAPSTPSSDLPMLDEPAVVPAASSGAPTSPTGAPTMPLGAPPRLHDDAGLGDLPYRSLERLTDSPRTDSFPAQAPAPARRLPTLVMGGPCRYCGQPLPEGRAVTYCPSCGQNVTVRHCPACSTELEIGWRFCITCGRQVDEEPAPSR